MDQKWRLETAGLSLILSIRQSQIKILQFTEMAIKQEAFNIDDLINAMILTMDSENQFIGPINIGNPNEISINELATKIIKLTNSKSKLIYEDLPMDDPKRRMPEISLAKQELKWSPKVKLETGLIETIKYFKNLLK